MLFQISDIDQKIKNFLLSTLLILGVISSITGPFKNKQDIYEFGTPVTKQNIRQLVSALKKENIEYGFCPNGLAQWQIMFYSNNTFILRYLNSTDRIQDNVDLVNHSYLKGQKTALILLKQEDQKNFQKDQIIKVTDRFSIVVYPAINELKVMGFDLSDIVND